MLLVDPDRTDRHGAEKAHLQELAETLREREAMLERELADARQLQAISSELIRENDVDALYGKILDAAVAMMQSDLGSMQLYYPERGELKLLAHRGFDPESASFWEWVKPGEGSTCGEALSTGKRSVVPDVETCGFVAGTEDLEQYRRAGIRSVQSTPLVTRSGEIVGMISTHRKQPHEPTERELRLLDVLARQAADLIERWRASASADRQQKIFHELIERCPFGMYIVDSDFTIASMNQRSQDGAFANVRPVIGRAFDEAMRILWPADVTQEIIGHFRHTMDSGESFYSRDFIRPRSDIEQVEGYEWELHRVALPSGKIGVICYYYDSTELRNAQRQTRLLLDELNHRVKNTLTLVQALAQQSFNRDAIPEAARAAFDGRLQALARAHDVLTSSHWEPAELSAIVAGALEACGAERRVRVSGPIVRIEPRTAVTMAMAIHELCTNAIKYGALSNEEGHVSLDWMVSGGAEAWLTIRWAEHGGPPVEPPSTTGFGSQMLERALAGEIGGEVRTDFRPEGLVCTIDAPLPGPAASAS